MSEKDYSSKSFVFISYSHRDKATLDDLLIHLEPLKSRNPFHCWSDKNISPGEKWLEEIERSLQRAKVAILLVSPHFLASEFISNRELSTLLSRAGDESLKIFWIPISSSAYQQTAISQYEAVWEPRKPLDAMSKPKRNQAFTEICEKLRQHLVAEDPVTGSEAPKAKVAKKEYETKFSHNANKQFKFIATGAVEEIFEKIRAFCKLLEINYGTQSHVQQDDYYYDDDDLHLQIAHASLRKRVKNKSFLVTIKQGGATSSGMDRYEHEFPVSESEFNDLISHPKKISELFLDHFGIKIEIGRLEHQFTIFNDRYTMPLETSDGNYLFCYDNYYYYYKKNGGLFSEYFYEIEIELQSEVKPGPDLQLEKLKESLSIIGFTSNNISKFEKGLQISHDNDNIKNFLCVSISIENYAKNQPSVQVQIIQGLNHYLKQAVNDFRKEENASDKIIYLPTGNGMSLIFGDSYTDVIPIIFSCQKLAKAANRESGNSRFEFRTSIHHGPVFKSTDLNENLNFGGSGICIANDLVAQANGWHILSSEEARSAMVRDNPGLARYFHELHTRRVSGTTIRMFNVFDREQQTGNPEAPEGNP